MSKMHGFSNKFSNTAKRWGMGAFRSQRPFTFNIGDMKFRDLAKLWIFKLIMKKSNFKKSGHFSDVIIITSPKNVTKMSQKFSILGLPPIKISGYASGVCNCVFYPDPSERWVSSISK